MNFLKKMFKKEDAYQCTNRLEELLSKAVENEAYRPDFYRQLFHYKFFVIGQKSNNNSLQFLNNDIDGNTFCYGYTSLAALEYITRKRGKAMPYLEIDSLQFFQMLTSSNLGLILNADISFGKIFNPLEIVHILNSENGKTQAREMNKGVEVQIGLPSNIPHLLVGALNKFVQKNGPIVKDIYFALKLEGGESSYIAAIDFQENCETKIENVANDISIILQEIPCDLPVDLAVANDSFRKTYADGAMLSCKNIKT